MVRHTASQWHLPKPDSRTSATLKIIGMQLATALHHTILQLPRIYKVDVPFVGVVKEAMKACGLPISSYSLPPAAPLSEEKVAVVRRVLTDAGII